MFVTANVFTLIIGVLHGVYRYHLLANECFRLLRTSVEHQVERLCYCSLCGIYLPTSSCIQDTNLEQVIHIGTNLYTICVIGVKSAILLEWIRIFNPHGVRNLFYWTCVSLLSANVVYYIGTAIAEHFSCIPYEKLWNRLLPGACYDWRPVNLSAAVVNIASDIIILCAPQRVIWNLRLSRKRKLGVSVVFLVGIMYVIISRLCCL